MMSNEQRITLGQCFNLAHLYVAKIRKLVAERRSAKQENRVVMDGSKKRIYSAKKLSQNVVDDIVMAYASNMVNEKVRRGVAEQLAAKYGISKHTVWNVASINKDRIMKLSDSTPKAENPKPTKKDMTKSERMRYIMGRIQKMIAIDNTIRYETAFRRASEEWNDMHTARKPVISFPDLHPLDSNGTESFKRLLEYLYISKPDGQIKYSDATQHLQTKKLSKVSGNYIQWSYSEWEKFCTNVMMAKDAISVATGKDYSKLYVELLPNGFKVIKMR